MKNSFTEQMRRPAVTAATVFPPSGFPFYTYARQVIQEKKFLEAWPTLGRPILVLGLLNCGKTSFLKAHFLDYKKDTIWFGCTSTSTFMNIVYHSLKYSTPSYKERNLLKKIRRWVEEGEEYIQRMVLDRLVRSRKYLVVDDIEKLPADQRFILGQFLLLAVDMGVKVVVSAAFTTLKELGFPASLDKHKLELIYLSHLRHYQMRDIIHKGEQKLNIRFSRRLVDEFINQSACAQDCQSLCLHVCSKLGIEKRQRRTRYIDNIDGIIRIIKAPPSPQPGPQ